MTNEKDETTTVELVRCLVCNEVMDLLNEDYHCATCENTVDSEEWDYLGKITLTLPEWHARGMEYGRVLQRAAKEQLGIEIGLKSDGNLYICVS